MPLHGDVYVSTVHTSYLHSARRNTTATCTRAVETFRTYSIQQDIHCMVCPESERLNVQRSKSFKCNNSHVRSKRK